MGFNSAFEGLNSTFVNGFRMGRTAVDWRTKMNKYSKNSRIES